jgi:hypothetical protein
MQALENPDIESLDYQRGTLFGTELWEYLLEKWGRRCAYCDAENVPLEADHIVPKIRGGSNRVSNLVVVCRKCNQRKGSQAIESFLVNDPERLGRILSHNQETVDECGSGEHNPRSHKSSPFCYGTCGSLLIWRLHQIQPYPLRYSKGAFARRGLRRGVVNAAQLEYPDVYD